MSCHYWMLSYLFACVEPPQPRLHTKCSCAPPPLAAPLPPGLPCIPAWQAARFSAGCCQAGQGSGGGGVGCRVLCCAMLHSLVLSALTGQVHLGAVGLLGPHWVMSPFQGGLGWSGLLCGKVAGLLLYWVGAVHVPRGNIGRPCHMSGHQAAQPALDSS